MKKACIISLLTVMLIFVLCGCQNTTSKNEDLNINRETLAKAQEIEVTLADTSSHIATLSGKSDIDSFINGIDWENLEVSELPHEDGTKELVFTLSQKDTIKLGETSSDGTLKEIGSITTYENTPYITLSTSGVSINLQISKETQEYLHSFIVK